MRGRSRIQPHGLEAVVPPRRPRTNRTPGAATTVDDGGGMSKGEDGNSGGDGVSGGGIGRGTGTRGADMGGVHSLHGQSVRGGGVGGGRSPDLRSVDGTLRRYPGGEATGGDEAEATEERGRRRSAAPPRPTTRAARAKLASGRAAVKRSAETREQISTPGGGAGGAAGGNASGVSGEHGQGKGHLRSATARAAMAAARAGVQRSAQTRKKVRPAKYDKVRETT